MRRPLPRRWLYGLALASAAFLSMGSLGPAPEANASPDLYLDELRDKVRAPLSDEEAFWLGGVACDAMRAAIADGSTMGQARHEADEAVGRAQNRRGLGLSLPDGMFLVEAAEHQLC